MPPDSPRPAHAAENHLPAILLILAAFGIYTLQDTGVKFCGGRYPLAETIVFLSVGAVIAIILFSGRLPVLLGVRGWSRRTLPPGQFAPLLAYGIISGIGSITTFYVYTQMPLANAYAIAFARPFTVALLAHHFLRERLDAGVALAILVGFCGVILMLPLKAGGSMTGMLVAVFSMLCSSVSLIVLRRARGQSAVPLAVCLYLVLLVSNLTIAFQDFVMPSYRDLAINIGAGLAGGIGTLMTIRALQKAPAAIVAPFHYSQLFWGILSGWIVFGTIPDAQLFWGAPLVILSGLYIGIFRNKLKFAIKKRSAGKTAFLSGVA